MTKSIANWEEILEKIIIHQQKGETDQVRKLIESILPVLTQNIQDNPNAAEHHNNIANAYKLIDKNHEALQHYHQALRLKNPYPEAENNLGALLYKMGRYDEAIAHFEKSLRSDPKSETGHYHLALALIQKNRLQEAVPHFEYVVKNQPHHRGAVHNLGIVYAHLKRSQEAEPLLLQAIEWEPQHVEALYLLATVQNSLGKIEDAKQVYQKLLALNPNHANAHHNLATLYLQINDKDKALEHYQNAYRLDPNNLTAQHMIAALTGKTLPEGAPHEFTRALFNQYAFNYDQHVKQMLGYTVPYKLRTALAPYVKDFTQTCQVLDLGCGTGLCAPYFRDLASKLIGVDLSDNMLMLAKAKGGYDKLIQDDLIHYLSTTEHKFDLIIAADVLVYMGELNTLFSLIKKTLLPNALFCFSTEVGNQPDYVLQSTGRYAHSTGYIQQLAKSNDLTILFNEKTELRLQDNMPIMGDLWVLKSDIQTTLS